MQILSFPFLDDKWKKGNTTHNEYLISRMRTNMHIFLKMQLGEVMLRVLKTDGEAREKAVKEWFEKLELLEEEGIKEYFPDGNIPCIGNDNIGLLELVMVSMLNPDTEIQEEVLGLKIIDPDKSPLFYSWLTVLHEIPLVKESAAPRDKIVPLLKFIRENALKSSST